MTIGQKLIWCFVGVALLVGLVGYISVNTSQKTLQKTIGENSVILAQETLDKIDRDIHNQIERWKSYCVANQRLKETASSSNQEFEKLDNIQEYIDQKDQEWLSAPKGELTPFMGEILNNELSQQLRKRVDFYERERESRVIGELFATNKYGANIAQTGKTTDYRQDDEEWWQMAKKNGFSIRDVEYDRSAGVYSTDIGIRIDDENGNFLGVIKVVLNIEEVVNIIKEVEASAEYETTQFKLLTKDGKLIYSTEDFELFEDFSNELLSRFHEERPEEQLGYFIAEGDKPGEGDELFAHAHSKGYRDYKGLGWILVIEYETKEIFTPITQLRNRLVIISLAVTVLAILMGLFISKAISNPLTRLRDAAIEIGKGNLDARFDVKSNNETGELAASFSDMTSKLKESHKQLEEKVNERTAELSSTNVKLKDEIKERKLAQARWQQHIKQLNCFYGLSKLIEKQKIPLEQIFQETPNLVRNAYRYPDITCVRITFDGIQYETDNFEKSGLSQYAEIDVREEKAGDIEVYYLGEKAESGQGPFLEEESDLLDAVAKRLGRIAERKRAAETLRLFRDLIERSNDCIFVIEPEWGRFLDVNDRTCSNLGYTREELLDMSLKDIDESILDDSTWQEHVEKLKVQADLVTEGKYKRKDGTTFCVETSLKFVKQEKKDYIIAVARDITERKQAEEVLRESEDKYRTLTENSLIGIFIHQDDRYVFVNDKFAEIHGYRPAELLGMEFWTLIHPDDRELAAQIKSKRLEGKDVPQRYEIRRVRKDGQIIWCENIITQTEYMGKPAAMGNVIDITERKRAEERQAQLLEEVESVNQELKDFAYIVSHDLKAPLRGIKTLANWMSTDYADKLDENGREQIDLLSRRVERMHNLIDGVLQYSRVGRIKEKKVKVNLNDRISEVIDTVAPPENIEITVENELPVIECEKTRIIQVFQNLLSNAVKYMNKPQGRIRIGCVEENGFWNFSVADNGPGIEEKHFERIFRIFQTLSPRDEFESTGVGLTIVKKIVELYGGKVWVESKLGEGSTFFFTLPEQMGVKDAKLEANIIGRR